MLHHRHGQMFVSKVILDPMKLVINTNHLSLFLINSTWQKSGEKIQKEHIPSAICNAIDKKNLPEIYHYWNMLI